MAFKSAFYVKMIQKNKRNFIRRFDVIRRLQRGGDD